MLELKNITKIYKVGAIKDNTYQEIKALNGVSINFRRYEFVAILGPSGCGKTTMLNIIGGLDKATSGDLEINNISTQQYKDSDWDNYRNNRIGFVFQNYNLIPHLSVLENVELSLTLGGVSRAERKERAKQALIKVGLEDKINVKPNQLSGGQMQRVAIARALINNPEIILADEPTGSIDSVTSRQIVEILKEISKERLVIMVTHNKELANNYATRIVNMLDGKLVSDSNPLKEKELMVEDLDNGNLNRKKNKKRMSFFTAFALSFKNLLTKKARTALVSFAGSMGIIGMALVLSVSNGFQAYINKVQLETLTRYPITVSESVSDYMNSMQSKGFQTQLGIDTPKAEGHKEDMIYDNYQIYGMFKVFSGTQKNDTKRFKEYIETQAIQENLKDKVTVKYTYNLNFNIFCNDAAGVKEGYSLLVNPYKLFDIDSLNETAMDFLGEIFEEMVDDEELIKSQYSLVAGDWAQENVYTEGEDNIAEVVIALDKDNCLPDYALMALGLRDREDLVSMLMGELPSWFNMPVSDILGKEYSLVLNPDMYEYNNQTGLYDSITTNESKNAYYTKDVASTSTVDAKTCVKLRVVGVIKPKDNAAAGCISSAVAYTKGLTNFIIDELAEYEANDLIEHNIIRDQLKEENKNKSVISGKFFELNEEEICDYYDDNPKEKEALTTEEKNLLSRYKALRFSLSNSVSVAVLDAFDEKGVSFDKRIERAGEIVIKNMSNFDNLSKQQRDAITNFSDTFTNFQEVSSELMDTFRGKVLDGNTMDETYAMVGKCRVDKPKKINFYVRNFEGKAVVESIIKEFNNNVMNDETLGSEEDRLNHVIYYNDNVGVIANAVSKIIIYVTYVLMAIVAIALVVSSIMIGIIIYISVLERRKEIGILRSVGASKRDIRNVFTAEGLMVGITSGIMGMVITLLLQVLTNIIFAAFTDIEVVAKLPPAAAFILIGVSIVLTFIAGLIPAIIASKKDPVEALRSE